MPRFQKQKSSLRREMRQAAREEARRLSKRNGGNKYVRQMALHFMMKGVKDETFDPYPTDSIN